MDKRANPSWRFYLQKQSGHELEDYWLKKELNDYLKVKVKNIISLTRFDIWGLEACDQAEILTFLSDPAQDRSIPSDLAGRPDLKAANLKKPDFELIVEAVLGQYDQRADFAAQCLKIGLGQPLSQLKAATHYLFYGDLSLTEQNAIRKWLINPVENTEGQAEFLDDSQKLEEEAEALDQPENIFVYPDFTALSDLSLEGFLANNNLAMTFADLKHIQAYFRRLGRQPTETEMKLLDTYWSDHCRHTTFNTVLENIGFAEDFSDQSLKEHFSASWQRYLDYHHLLNQEEGKDKDICLMDLATIATKILKRENLLADLDESEEINACSIKVEAEDQGGKKEILLMFKNETHNHPTEIEPFGGASTCLGGAIRDPLSGRAYSYQAMRISGGGDPRQALDKTRPGKLPQRQIARAASLGYSSYGNQIGIAAGQVQEFYHPGFEAKRLEAGAIVAAVPAEQVCRCQPRAGDLVLLIGGRTGRDGVGGATGSSVGHDKKSHQKSAAEVQKGNPPLERNLQRLFRKPEFSLLIRRCNDFGAGGVAVAVGELADGLEINLDAVPLKYPGLNGTEIALSESQERMAVVISKENLSQLLELAEKENLEATVIAKVTADNKLKMNWRQQTIVDLDRSFLATNGAQQKADAVFSPSLAADWFNLGAGNRDFKNKILARAKNLSHCSKRGLIERFDSSIGAGTVLPPLGGRNELTPEMGMASLIPLGPKKKSNTVSLMAAAYDPYLAEASPYHGAYFAVLSALSKITALGGDPFSARLSFQEYFGRVMDDKSWGKPLTALLGAFDACLAFKVPAIGGKDSMSGSYEDLNVPPSLIAFAVATTELENVISATFKQANESIYLFSVPLDTNYLVDLDPWLGKIRFLQQMAAEKKIKQTTVCDSSGIAFSLCQSLLGETLGFDFSFTEEIDLFAPAPGSLLVAFDSDLAEEEISAGGGVFLGRTSKKSRLNFNGEIVELEEILTNWLKPLKDIYPLGKEELAANNYLQAALKDQKKAYQCPKPNLIKKKPQVLIPILPGTNSEDDLARAFTRAGAKVEQFVFRNLTATAIKESRDTLAKMISAAQILVFPGASDGFAKAVFMQAELIEAVNKLLARDDSLILGTGRGFAELLQLGLLTRGKLKEAESSLSLGLNSRGTFISRAVYSRYMNVKSPWFELFQPDQVDKVPIGGANGRLHLSLEDVDILKENKQIAFCYAEPDGRLSQDDLWNPCGSTAGIEGLIDPSGKILGRFAFSERIFNEAGHNFSRFGYQPILESAVKWLNN